MTLGYFLTTYKWKNVFLPMRAISLLIYHKMGTIVFKFPQLRHYLEDEILNQQSRA